MKKRFSEEQIIGFLCEAEAGLAVKELRRKHGFSEASWDAARLHTPAADRTFRPHPTAIPLSLEYADAKTPWDFCRTA